MKYCTTLALILVSTSQLANAGKIVSEFKKDDTLTAAKMTEIRDAVNENDANIANKQTNIGTGCTSIQAIRSIDSRGTVTCTDIPQGGPGGGATTDYYYISGSDLRPIEDTAEGGIRWNSYDINGQYSFPVVPGKHEVGHGVRLPNGSTITDMRCYYYDNEPAYNIDLFDFNLYEREIVDGFEKGQPRKGGDRFTGKQITQGGTADDKRSTGASDEIKESVAKSSSGRALNHTINNAKNAYYMRLRMVIDNTSYHSLNSNDRAADENRSRSDTSNLRTYGCRITYTH